MSSSRQMIVRASLTLTLTLQWGVYFIVISGLPYVFSKLHGWNIQITGVAYLAVAWVDEMICWWIIKSKWIDKFFSAESARSLDFSGTSHRMLCTGTLSMFDKEWTAYSYLTSSDAERPRMVLKLVYGLLWLLVSYLRSGALYSVRLQRLVRHGSDLALASSWFWVSRQFRFPCHAYVMTIGVMIIRSGSFYYPSMLSGLVSIDIPIESLPFCRYWSYSHSKLGQLLWSLR